MILVICEKFLAASDLASALGCSERGKTAFSCPKGLLSITWLDGHLLRLAEPEIYNKAWLDRASFPVLPSGFQYVPKDKNAGSWLQQVKRLVSKASEVVNACDAGREGELIFRLLWEFIGSPKTPVKRLWLHTTTVLGIQEAWGKLEENFTPKFDGLAEAGRLRGQADWLLGINGSRIASSIIPGEFWTVGRVQTSVLATVYDRDTIIANFRSRQYFSLYLRFTGKDSYEGRICVPEGFQQLNHFTMLFADEAESVGMEYLLKRLEGVPWGVKEKRSTGNIYPQPLFDLLGLQRLCSIYLGWSAARTLAAAQEAYAVDKTITYPRTDSRFLPDDFKAHTDKVYAITWEAVVKESPTLERFSPPTPSTVVKYTDTFDSKKVSDHYAIIPTGILPSNQDSDSFALWRVVSRRFLLHFFEPAVTTILSRETFLDYTLPQEFAGRPIGQVIKLNAVTKLESLTTQGWLSVASAMRFPVPDTLPRERNIPEPEGLMVKLEKVEPYQNFTEPPEHYTEDSLLANMGSKNLGTPATRASMLETLVTRDYLKRSAGSPPTLRVAKKGSTLISELRDKNLSFITLPDLTSNWEENLHKIETKALDAQKGGDFLLGVEGRVKEMVALAKGDNSMLPPVFCPKTNKPIIHSGGAYFFPGYSFPFPEKLAGRYMLPHEYRDILIMTKFGFGPLKGFITKGGKPFDARISFDEKEGKLSFVF